MRADPARQELVTAALLGTDRRPVDTDELTDPATLLLDRAARSNLAARAGAVLPQVESPVAGPGEHPRWASVDAQAIMARLLVQPRADLVNLWLAAAAAGGLGLAPPHWAAVLAYASRSAEVSRPFLAAVLGEAGLWFVGQNPAWSKLAGALANRPSAPVAPSPTRVVESDHIQLDPELIFSVPDPWPRPLVEVALMVIGTARLQWGTAAYATSLGARLPFELAPLVRSAADFFAPPDSPITSRLVRDGFAALDRTLHLRVEIHQAFGGATLGLHPQETP